MTVNRVTLITLGVSDLTRAVEFYTTLGWEPSEVLDKVAFFDMNGMKLGLYTLEGLAEDMKRPVETLKTGAMTLGQNFQTEAEVEAAYDVAITAGGEVITRPEKVFWGGYSGYFADPDGHVWEYSMNPYWEMDAEGYLS